MGLGINRARVLKDGKITFNAGGSLINCSIRDLTVGGAKVRLIASTALPEYFELLCVADEILYPAKMAWRRGEYVGFTFVGPPRRMPHRKKPRNQMSLA